MIASIKKIALVGGTHGGELTGIFLIKKFKQYPHLIQRYGFESIAFISNEKAVEVGTRYIDIDLNRAFNCQDLKNPQLINYEQSLAKKIAQRIQQEKIDLVIDLHSTTSNMGLTVILHGDNPDLLKMAGYLTQTNSKVRILQHELNKQSSYLISSAELGVTIEVGAVANGVLDAKLFQETENLVYAILDYLEADKKGQPLPVPPSFTYYSAIGTVDYPRNEQGKIQAMIHPQLQFQDYQPLNPGNPIFITFDGEEIFYQGDETVYPVFINEAAYYEKGTAMCLTKAVRN
ncbi:succinylglutamate desuccinylase/aspartoacylase [Calothrix parasitica NIES-267]|uniref:Probable aspartoacylase n=1 Tax=Calothrix parasitica NIES-267 TaxID=1973488 RepID=A0A1Z4LJA2_9CYAN|nr:succinylglutamate desuccinylase/aspartoacylase [Calothrix parasitica NIES-267]